MVKEFFSALYALAVDMGFYMIIGLVLVGLINLFIKKEWIARHLGGSGLWDSIKASLFGVPLPICSCGVVPTGLYLKKQGASDAATVSFLTSTPQTGIDSIIATYGLMGPVFAWFRPVAALVSGVFGGIMTHLFGDKAFVSQETTAPACASGCCSDSKCCDGGHCQEEHTSGIERGFKAWAKYAFVDFPADIALHFVIGLIIAALISVIMPADLLARLNLQSGLPAMLIMIALGAPMYICSTSSIPIALMLMAKGLSPGAAFVFLFMGPFTNAASLSILGKQLGTRNTVIYLLSAVVSSLSMGYLLDWIFRANQLAIPLPSAQTGNETYNIIQTIIAFGFIAIVIIQLYRRLALRIHIRRLGKNETKEDIYMKEFKVTGMSCGHCVAHVKEALLSVEGVTGAEVSLENSNAKVSGEFDADAVVSAVHEAGYTAVQVSP